MGHEERVARKAAEDRLAEAMEQGSVEIPGVTVEYSIGGGVDPSQTPLLMVTTRGNSNGTATFEVFAQNMGGPETLASVLNVLATTLKEKIEHG